MPLNPLQLPITKNIESLITETVLDCFSSAEDARNKKVYELDDKGNSVTYNDKITLLNDMFYGKRKPKEVPWKYCSNRSMKIAMAIIEMLHSRMFPAVWNEDLVRWRPVEQTDKTKTERTTKFMDWWVRVWTRMKTFYNRWVKVCLAYGDSLVEVSWETTEIYTGDTTTPITDEFGIQLYEQDGKPSTQTTKNIKVEERTRTEIIPRENVYLQDGQTSLSDEPVIIKCQWSFSDLEKLEAQGMAVNINTPLNSDTKTLRQQLMEGIESTNSFSGENAEILKEIKLRSQKIEVLKCYHKIDIDRDGFAEDIRVLVSPLYRIYLGGVYVKDISKRGKRPIDFTKVNDLINNVDALEGYGYLEMVKALADEIDAIFNQMTDANTLSVLRPFFYDPSGNLVPQNITLAPNKGIPVPDPSRNVYIPDFQIPTERLMIAIKGVLEFIERLTGASSYVMGKESEIVGGSGTATRTQAIVGAAEQRFAMPAEKLREGASRILTLVLDQVQLNLPNGFESRVLGEDGEPVFTDKELTTDNLDPELDAFILEDAAMGSKSVERELSIFLYQLLMQNPLVATDPIKLYNETANLLKSHGQNPEEHLGPAPEAKDFDTPEEENTLIVQGDFTQVMPMMTENHLEHIMKHEQIFQSPTLTLIQMKQPELFQQVAQYTQMHIMQHQQMLQQMIGMVQQQGAGQQKGAKGGGQAENSGAASQSGMEQIPGTVSAVAQRQREGKSEFAPTSQPQ